MLSAASLAGCGQPAECASPDYRRAECRILAEREFSRLRTSTGLEVRMQEPGAASAEHWAVTGLIRERGGQIAIRVATLGPFSVSLHNPDDGGEDIEARLELTNVHPAVELELADTPIDHVATGTRRSLALTIAEGDTVFVHGTLACDRPVRLLALADVQTNPTQFERIIAHIHEHELADAEQAGHLLAGAVFAGDLTESSTEDEFRIFADLLEPIPIPFSLTPGNHDVYASHLPFYNQNFGPGNYEFDVCDVHVAMLDTGSGSIAPSLVGRLHALFSGAEDREHSIAVMHHPPYAALTGDGWGSEDLAMITLGEFAHQEGDLVIAGHSHMLQEFRDISVAGARLVELIVGTGGADQGAGSPVYGYLRLTFEGSEPSYCFVEVPPPGAESRDRLPLNFPQCP